MTAWVPRRDRGSEVEFGNVRRDKGRRKPSGTPLCVPSWFVQDTVKARMIASSRRLSRRILVMVTVHALEDAEQS